MAASAKMSKLLAPLRPIFSESLRSSLIELRNDLHRHPELSFQEHRTASRLYDELARLKPAKLDRVGTTGVVATFTGRNPRAPLVAVRADIDALPIQEATGLRFQSLHTGVMHACGHDVHATWGIGAAHLLSKNPAEGNVLVLFQPAEELGKGARAILKSGALKNVAAMFGAHVDRRFPVGQVIAQEGPLAASTDTFIVDVIGKGAHGARPHEGADPIVAASAIVTALQTIVSRKLNPARAGVVTVGALHAGSAPNVIPERASMTGTLRAVDPETRLMLKKELKAIAVSIAEAHHVKAIVTIEKGTPPVVNPVRPVEWARTAITGLLGQSALVPLPMFNMAGEDFAYYQEKMPACFLRIGACEEGGKPIAAHSAQFYAGEESIFVGSAVLAAAARVASSELARMG